MTHEDRDQDREQDRRHRRDQWWNRWWRRSAGVAAAVAVGIGVSVVAGPWQVGADVHDLEESSFVPVQPERILDTRDPNNVGLDGPFVSATPQTLQVTGFVPTANGEKMVVPPGATGVVLNVTPVNAASDGFISVRPGDASGSAATSNLNFEAGDIVPNAVLVGLPIIGPEAGTLEITFDAYGAVGPTTDIVIDVMGYMSRSKLQQLHFATELLLSEHSLVNAFVENDGVAPIVHGSEVLTASVIEGPVVELEVFGVELHETTHTVQVTLTGNTTIATLDRMPTVNFHDGRVHVYVYDESAGSLVDSSFSVTITPHGGQF